MINARSVQKGAFFGILVLLFSVSVQLDSQEDCVPSIDPYDGVLNHRNIQACLDKRGLVLLPSVSPYILLRHTLFINSDTTLSSLDESYRPTLLADPEMGNESLLLTRSSGSSNYHISNIIFDGNKYKRDYENGLCWTPQRTPANIFLKGFGFSIHNIESRNAVCGTGLGLLGRDFNVYENDIHDNGWSAGMWPNLPTQFSDGMTVIYCNNGAIYNNVIGDNSDFDMVFGGGPNCRVFGNTIYHRHVFGFTGINIGHFNTETKGEWDGKYTGSLFFDNHVRAEMNTLMYGLSVGSHPFTTTPDAFHVHDAGTFTGNSSYGAQINFIVDGVGEGNILGNSFGQNRGSRKEYNEYGLSFNFVAGHNSVTVKLQKGYAKIVCDAGKCKNESE